MLHNLFSIEVVKEATKVISTKAIKKAIEVVATKSMEEKVNSNYTSNNWKIIHVSDTYEP